MYVPVTSNMSNRSAKCPKEEQLVQHCVKIVSCKCPDRNIFALSSLPMSPRSRRNVCCVTSAQCLMCPCPSSVLTVRYKLPCPHCRRLKRVPTLSASQLCPHNVHPCGLRYFSLCNRGVPSLSTFQSVSLLSTLSASHSCPHNVHACGLAIFFVV